jgi:glycine cleavage system aminomethyltransferase T
VTNLCQVHFIAERSPFSHHCWDPVRITKGYGVTQNDFKAAFQQWQERCDWFITAQGDYFEGDGSQT